jgi:hypothetical protein
MFVLGRIEQLAQNTVLQVDELRKQSYLDEDRYVSLTSG